MGTCDTKSCFARAKTLEPTATGSTDGSSSHVQSPHICLHWELNWGVNVVIYIYIYVCTILLLFAIIVIYLIWGVVMFRFVLDLMIRTLDPPSCLRFLRSAEQEEKLEKLVRFTKHLSPSHLAVGVRIF